MIRIVSVAKQLFYTSMFNVTGKNDTAQSWTGELQSIVKTYHFIYKSKECLVCDLFSVSSSPLPLLQGSPLQHHLLLLSPACVLYLHNSDDDA